MSLSTLIAAIIAVESGGNDLAIGDGGKAIGPLQIHRAYVQDVNERCGTHYRWESMTNRTEAVEVFTLYIRIYAPKNATEEQIARIHNGGPKGHRRASTLPYWRKVQRKLSLQPVAGGVSVVPFRTDETRPTAVQGGGSGLGGRGGASRRVAA